MQFVTIEPMNAERIDLYGQVIGAMRALAKPNGLSFGSFGIGTMIQAIEDVNGTLTVRYPNAASMVEYSNLFVRAWRLIVTPDVYRFVNHTYQGANAHCVATGDPFADEAKIAYQGGEFRYDVFPADDRQRHQSLMMVVGALKVPGYPAPFAADAPLLLGRHIVRMSWENGIVVIEWATADAFLAWAHVPMYAWRVAWNKPMAGTIRHVLPDGTYLDVDLWNLDPWKVKVNGYLDGYLDRYLQHEGIKPQCK